MSEILAVWRLSAFCRRPVPHNSTGCPSSHDLSQHRHTSSAPRASAGWTRSASGPSRETHNMSPPPGRRSQIWPPPRRAAGTGTSHRWPAVPHASAGRVPSYVWEVTHSPGIRRPCHRTRTPESHRAGNPERHQDARGMAGGREQRMAIEQQATLETKLESSEQE